VLIEAAELPREPADLLSLTTKRLDQNKELGCLFLARSFKSNSVHGR
jgi:hypothetical protein